MPLPWILGGIALAVIGGVAIMGLMEYLDNIKKLKAEKGATEAKITDKIDRGEFNVVKTGLFDEGRKIGDVECKVKSEDARQLRVGQTIWSQKSS